MSKITGLEEIEKVPPKVQQLYRAVVELLGEGTDAAELRVSTITDRAGIGKGTAYEYFDTKEDIVSSAVAYHVQSTFEWLEKVLLEKDTFAEQLEFLLDEMEKKDGRRFCFLRFVHILTDNSDFSRLVQQKLCAEKTQRYTPVMVFKNVMERAAERGELRKELPMDYMIYSLFAHLMTYMMAITTEDNLGIKPVLMRPFVLRGICDELCVKNK